MKNLFIKFGLGLALISALNAEPIKVAMDMSYPPFQFVENENLKGVEPEILAEVAKRSGLELVPQKFVFDEIFDAIENDKIDIAMAAIDITQERLAKFDFSVPYYATTNIFVTTEDNKEFTGPQDLAGKKIGVAVAGSTQETIAKAIPNAKVVIGRSLIGTKLLLNSGRIDTMIIESINIPAVLHDDYTYLSNVEKQSLAMLKEWGNVKKLEIFYIDFENSVNQGFMVKKGAKGELVEKINQALTTMKNDGTIDKILDKYGLR